MSNAPRVLLRVAYLGGGFAGWQRQSAERTVQGELETALAKLYGEPVRVTGAGRTDAGVHARGQVAHFDAPRAIPQAGVQSALNSLLADDVRVLAARHVREDFHARHDARRKVYEYRLGWGAPLDPWDALRTWHVPFDLDSAAMRAAARRIVGEHDFGAFALSGHAGTGRRGTARSVARADLVVRARRIRVVLEADGFLRGMARRIVGALVEVGRGAQPVTWLDALLAGTGARPPAPTAPAHGLTLMRVFYRER